MYDEVADAAEDRAAYLAEPARAHHDVDGFLARRHVDYELARLLEVRHELAAQLSVPSTARTAQHRPHTAASTPAQLWRASGSSCKE